MYTAIATGLGWWPGSRSDDNIHDAHRPLFLLDTHWTEYDWPAHLAVAMSERPALAAVPDITNAAQLPAVLDMAEEIAPHCDSILIIPKATVILPRCIGGTPVTLGYSVPTKYGSTELGLWEFSGWPVHLLGGTPLRQLTLARYLNVVSADGNMAQKMAHKGWIFNGRGQGVHLDSHEPRVNGAAHGMPARALTVSLTHIMALWRRQGFTVEPFQRSAA